MKNNYHLGENINKGNIYKLLYFCSIILFVGFVLRVIADYCKYNESYSSPFYITLIVRVIEFVVPAIILFLGATVLKRYKSK